MGIIPLTIHDSIIVHPDEVEKAVSVIETVFLENFNSIPTFHIEPLRKSNVCNLKIDNDKLLVPGHADNYQYQSIPEYEAIENCNKFQYYSRTSSTIFIMKKLEKSIRRMGIY